MTQVRRIPDAPASQPDFFVGWWEIVFHTRDGEQTDVTGIIEHVDAAGNFTVFRDGERIGAGHHVDFTVDPDGFTNVQEVAGAHTADRARACDLPLQRGRVGGLQGQRAPGSSNELRIASRERVDPRCDPPDQRRRPTYPRPALRLARAIDIDGPEVPICQRSPHQVRGTI